MGNKLAYLLINIILIFSLFSCSYFNKNNKDDGFVEIRNNNGIPIKINYLKDGIKEGPSISFFENGKVSGIVCYENDSILNGPLIKYFENGNINYYDNYLNGQKEGISVLYASNGIILRKSYYRNGVKHGGQYYFRRKNDTSKIETYEHGILKNVINK